MDTRYSILHPAFLFPGIQISNKNDSNKQDYFCSQISYREKAIQ